MYRLIEFQCPVCRKNFEELCSKDELPRCTNCGTQMSEANKTLNIKNNCSRTYVNDKAPIEPGIQQYVGGERVL